MESEIAQQQTSSDEPHQVVILVHGIRTFAPWVSMIRDELENVGIKVELTNYGRLDTFRFLIPFNYFRSRPINEVWNSIREVRQIYPNAHISFIAHSFGTFIISKILLQEFDFRAHRVIFCGSVVPYNFPFNQIADRFTSPIINEVSTHDPWPVVAESLTFGFGSAGTFGFRVPRIRDRWHKGSGHSQYLERDFCRKYWIPFFLDGKIVEGNTSLDNPPKWQQILSAVSIKLIFAVVLTSFGIYWLAQKYRPNIISSELATKHNIKESELGVNEFSCVARSGTFLNHASSHLQTALSNAPFYLLRPQSTQVFLKTFTLSGRKEGVSFIFTGQLERTNVNLEISEIEFQGAGNHIFRLTGNVTLALATTDNPASFRVASPQQFRELKSRLTAAFQVTVGEMHCIGK